MIIVLRFLQLVEIKHLIDMVIEQVDKAVWVNLGSKSEIAENLRLEKVRENLSEREELVLTFVEDRDTKIKACLLL